MRERLASISFSASVLNSNTTAIPVAVKMVALVSPEVIQASIMLLEPGISDAMGESGQSRKLNSLRVRGLKVGPKWHPLQVGTSVYDAKIKEIR